MKRNILYIIYRIAFLVYLFLLLFFIFGNSFASKEESAATSSVITEIINSILGKLNLQGFRDGIIRKVAHFVEFFVLGSSVSLGRLLYMKFSKANTVYCIFFCVLTAMTDETIQFFTDRGSMLTDVWLDSFASFIGVMLFSLLIYKIIKNKKIDSF